MTESSTLPPRVPARLVLASIAGMWLCYLLVTTLRSYLVGLEYQGPLFGRRLAVTIACMAVTAAIWKERIAREGLLEGV